MIQPVQKKRQCKRFQPRLSNKRLIIKKLSSLKRWLKIYSIKMRPRIRKPLRLVIRFFQRQKLPHLTISEQQSSKK